jgi:hypothetical protein
VISFTAGHEILLLVEDDVVAAVGLRELGLVRAAGRADHRGAQVLRPLAGDQADAAGRGVEQDRVAGVDLVGLAQQVLCGHALEHHRRRLLVGDGVRAAAPAPWPGRPAVGVGAQRAGVGDPLPDLDLRHALAHRLDDARPSLPGVNGRPPAGG